jgi:hypothetical protein
MGATLNRKAKEGATPVAPSVSEALSLEDDGASQKGYHKMTTTTATTISKVTGKSGNLLGWLIRSDSNGDTYQVTWNAEAYTYQCDCKAFQFGHGSCKHTRAVSELIAAQVQAKRQVALLHSARGQGFTALDNVA